MEVSVQISKVPGVTVTLIQTVSVWRSADVTSCSKDWVWQLQIIDSLFLLLTSFVAWRRQRLWLVLDPPMNRTHLESVAEEIKFMQEWTPQELKGLWFPKFTPAKSCLTMDVGCRCYLTIWLLSKQQILLATCQSFLHFKSFIYKLRRWRRVVCARHHNNPCFSIIRPGSAISSKLPSHYRQQVQMVRQVLAKKKRKKKEEEGIEKKKNKHLVPVL